MMVEKSQRRASRPNKAAVDVDSGATGRLWPHSRMWSPGRVAPISVDRVLQSAGKPLPTALDDPHQVARNRPIEAQIEPPDGRLASIIADLFPRIRIWVMTTSEPPKLPGPEVVSRRPAWVEPPADVVSGVVPVELVLARTPQRGDRADQHPCPSEHVRSSRPASLPAE
jgi:hypothetical protein